MREINTEYLIVLKFSIIPLFLVIINSIFQKYLNGIVFTITLLFLNIFLMFRSYSLVKKYSLTNSLTSFFLYFIFIFYFHLGLGVEWILTPIANILYQDSIIISIGHLINIPGIDIINLTIILFLLVLDFKILIIFYKFLLNFYLKHDLRLSGTNVKIIRTKISVKSIFFATAIILMPILHVESFSLINDTSDGVAYIIEGINLILKSDIQNRAFNFNSILNDGSSLIKIKNNFYLAGIYFEKASNKLESLSSLKFSQNFPILLNFVKEMGNFSKSTIPFVISLFEDYLQVMNGNLNEILRRAYWWELEEQNISYDPKSDFYDKLNNKMHSRIAYGSFILSNHINKLSSIILKSNIGKNPLILNLFDELGKLNTIYEQLTLLTYLGTPLLNATFASVEVTNALAFDLFKTAQKLTNRSNFYFTSAKSLLDSYPYSYRFESIVDEIVILLSQFNTINIEFETMTKGTESMFNNIASSILFLNSTSFFSNKYFSKLKNIEINNSLNNVEIIVNNNIHIIENYLSNDFSFILRPFEKIFKHFKWFYDGYSGAVIGYRNFWIASNMTIGLFDDTQVLIQKLDNFMVELKNSDQNIDKSNFTKINNDFEIFNSKIIKVTELIQNSVTDGAIITNEDLWYLLLGYNNVSLGTGFYEFYSLYNYLKSNFEIRNLYANSTRLLQFYYNWKVNIEFFLSKLTGSKIFIRSSEELSPS